MTKLIKDPPFPHNYASELLGLERGKGVYVWDTEGNRYLDLGAGIAVNALGYGRRDLARIASRQMQKLIHVSNLYATRPAISLASRLLSLVAPRLGDYAAVQFGNSGSEANEAALKYARLYAQKTRGPGHHKILSLSNAFHGRTMGALSATPNKKYSQAFEPLLPGTAVSDFNDVKQLENTLNEEFAAVIVEVVQGEGGLRVMSAEFADALNRISRQHDVILIADEIQTGLGRTGPLFASELVGLKPDILTLSKPLAGGLPLSATIIPAKINDLLNVGDHGTTFGGGPVTCAVAHHVVDTIADPRFLARVAERAQQLTELLDTIVAESGEVSERRGIGMLQGIVVEGNDSATRIPAIMNSCQEAGVLLLRSSSNVVRIAPPLVINEKELALGVMALRKILGI
jgi:acetylornithine/N-succinyldiaminopimelate aminotransferase